jgi:tetratricopeptide (TPR) repeat protein
LEEHVIEEGDPERKQEMLAAARRAYWSKDIPLAIRRYQALIQGYPNEPDYYGELGNIYFKEGEHERAGEAYYEAALLLLDRGERDRAKDLLDLLEKTAPAYAEELARRLAGTP